MAFLTGSNHQSVTIYDLASETVRTVACPSDATSSNGSFSSGECNGSDPIGFVGDTLVDVDQEFVEQVGNGQEISVLAPSASTWKKTVLKNVENSGQGLDSSASDVFTDSGVVEFVSAQTSGSAPYGAYLITTRGVTKYLANVPGDGPPIPGTSNVLIQGMSSGLELLSLATGMVTPAPLPPPPQGEFWSTNSEFTGGHAYLAMEALPNSCQSSQELCPPAPIVRYELVGTKWKSTGVVQKGIYQTADGRLVAVESVMNPNSSDYQYVDSLMVDGRTLVADSSTLIFPN